jgi:hypothetical protein
MSSTKIVIIVLVLIGLLFIIFVARGALRNDPAAKSDQQTAKKTKPPNWTKTIKSVFSRLKPGVELKQKTYSSISDETIGPDDKQPFRTITFHRVSGISTITYTDITPIEPGSDLSKNMDRPQVCTLPQTDADVSDRQRCSIIAFKRGGTLHFECALNSACKVEVE